jgi:hypothetical protein
MMDQQLHNAWKEEIIMQDISKRALQLTQIYSEDLYSVL